MFKVKFRDEHDKEIYTVFCKTEDLDLRSHPYFVSINRLMGEVHSPLLELNSKEKRRFKDTHSLLIPIQSVILIEKLDDEKPRIVEVKINPSSLNIPNKIYE